MSGPRFTGNCTGCQRQREVESREDHAMKTLCDECAGKPHRRPSAPLALVASPDDPPPAKAPPARTRTGVRTLRVLDTLAMLRTPPPPVRWVLAPLAARGHLNLLAGREKTGKSLLAFAVAVAAAHGCRELAGLPVTGGRTVLVDAENGQVETHRRAHGMAVREEAAPNLILCEARGFSLALHMGELRELVIVHKPDLLILDSFSAMWAGDENDRGEVHAALDPLRNLAHDHPDLAVLLLHHTIKGGTEYRGSSGIGAAVENISLLSRDDADEDGQRRKLRHNRSRFAPDGEDYWLRIVAHDGLISLEEAEPYEPQRERPRDTWREAVAEALSDIPQGERKIALGTGVPRSTVQRLLADLADEGIAESTPRGWVAHRPTPYRGLGHLGHPTGNGHEDPDLAAQHAERDDDERGER